MTKEEIGELCATIVCRNNEIEELIIENKNYFNLILMIIAMHADGRFTYRSDVFRKIRDYIDNNASYEGESAETGLNSVFERIQNMEDYCEDM